MKTDSYSDGSSAGQWTCPKLLVGFVRGLLEQQYIPLPGQVHVMTGETMLGVRLGRTDELTWGQHD